MLFWASFRFILTNINWFINLLLNSMFHQSWHWIWGFSHKCITLKNYHRIETLFGFNYPPIESHVSHTSKAFSKGLMCNWNLYYGFKLRVGVSMGRYVCLSVRRSVGPSVCPQKKIVIFRLSCNSYSKQLFYPRPP